MAFAGLMNETRSTIKRNAARNLEGGRHAAKPDELRMLPIIGPSGSTKSKTIQIVTERIHRLRESEDMPVLVATLWATTRHTRDLQADVIASFRDPSARVIRTMHDYSEAAVNAAIMKMARKKGTVLVVLDEAHNMVKESGPEAMAQAIKSILNDAVFSIVLVGTDELKPLFRHTELTQRCKAPISFAPPSLADAEGCREFFEFVEKHCNEMHRVGAIGLPFLPTRHLKQCAALFDMCDGNIGRVVRIFRLALEEAITHGMLGLDWDTVMRAFDVWQELHPEFVSRKGQRTQQKTMDMVRSIVAG
jgi:hypothetical protein